MSDVKTAEHRTAADNLRWLAGHLDEPAFDMPGCAHWLKHAADLLDATPGATLSGEASELSGEASRPRELLPSNQHVGDSISKLLADMATAAHAARTNQRDGVAAFVNQWIERLKALTVETPADGSARAMRFTLAAVLAAAGGRVVVRPEHLRELGSSDEIEKDLTATGDTVYTLRREVKTSPRYGIPEVLAFLRERTEWLRKEDKHFAADECDYIRQCIEDTSSRLSPGLAEQIADAQRRIAAWPPDVRAAMGLPDTRTREPSVLFRAAGWLAAPDGESRESTTLLIQALVAHIKNGE